MKFVYKFFWDIYFEVLLAVFGGVYLAVVLPSSFQKKLGLLLSFVFILLWVKSRYDLGKSFSVKPEAEKLVTNGIYSKISHPMYLFSDIAVLGLAIALNHLILYIFLILLVIIHVLRIKKENNKLLNKFGEHFVRYKQGVWF